MNIEADSQPDLYQYFLAEAPDLLQSIEDTLLSLIDEKTTDKVHILMRSAHTLKGSAASVKEETIQTIAHHLEDVFQALYPSEVEIDPELGSLLLEGYECLCTPIHSALSGISYDENAILQQTAAIFAQLKEKLGDFFGREAPIPTSDELGFDVVGSIFQDSITEELDDLQQVISDSDAKNLENVLRSFTQFLLELGISYQLTGLEEISQTVLLALDSNPDEVQSIAQVALENFYQARETILAGDRVRGGEVLPQLKEWIEMRAEEKSPSLDEEGILDDLEVEFIDSTEEERNYSLSSEFKNIEIDGEITNENEVKGELDIVIESIYPENKEKILSSSESDDQSDDGSYELQTSENQSTQLTSPIDRILASLKVITNSNQKGEARATAETETSSFSGLKSRNSSQSSKPSIKVAIEQLDTLNHTISELFIKENQINLQYGQLNYISKEVIQEFRRCQQQLSLLSDWSDQQFKSSWKNKHQENFDTFPKKSSKQKNINNKNTLDYSTKNINSQFDALEMEAYSDLHLILQRFTESMTQLEEKIDFISQVLQKSYLNFGKRKQLLQQAQEQLFQARMVSLETVLNRFSPLLKQTIANYGKPAEIKFEGMEVSIDKAIGDKLYEPLLHLIRNAYDHGLESPEIRRQQGKSEIGRILIRAYYQGNRVIIEVEDDGGGLDWEKIRAKAVENELLLPSEAASIPESELAEILFEPGFSTAEKLTNLSGRGVGLDVVRSQLTDVQGSIGVRSVLGKGTTFVLQLPLNLITARLLLCQSQGIVYALLSKEIDRVLLPLPEQIQTQESLMDQSIQHFLRWQEGENTELIPICLLGDLINYQYPFLEQRDYSNLSYVSPKQERQKNCLLMIKTNNRKLCLQVERIISEQELVIKSLKSIEFLPDYIQGYCVLGDGNLSLAIDPANLAVKFRENNSNQGYDWRKTHSEFPLYLNSAKDSDSTKIIKADLVEESIGIENKSATSLVETPQILVIEDSIVQRQSIIQTLKKDNYRIIQAENGREGIIQLNKNPYISLIICDVEMPVMNGFEFLNYCHQNSSFSEIPIVMLTTRSGVKHRQLALALGAKSYQTKPYSDRVLLETVKKLIDFSDF